MITHHVHTQVLYMSYIQTKFHYKVYIKQTVYKEMPYIATNKHKIVASEIHFQLNKVTRRHRLEQWIQNQS